MNREKKLYNKNLGNRGNQARKEIGKWTYIVFQLADDLETEIIEVTIILELFDNIFSTDIGPDLHLL